MAKTTKKYSELLALVQSINFVFQLPETRENSKGSKKLQKIGEKMKTHLDFYNDKLDEIRLDHANTDKDGSLLVDEKGGYKFTKDGIKEMNKKVKELLDSTFEFYQFTFSHEGLDKFAFLEGWVEGLTFPEETDEVEPETNTEAIAL